MMCPFTPTPFLTLSAPLFYVTPPFNNPYAANPMIPDPKP